ncbi:MAG: hypothetical protein HDR35_05960 [Treponema sp.]|nr:hypothetical protein [Treponema sp.]
MLFSKNKKRKANSRRQKPNHTKTKKRAQKESRPSDLQCEEICKKQNGKNQEKHIGDDTNFILTEGGNFRGTIPTNFQLLHPASCLNMITVYEKFFNSGG